MRSRKIIISVILALLCTTASAQLFPERRLIRSGNKDFNEGDYARSEVNYLRAREKNQASYEAAFNLSDTYYKQERYEESEKNFGEMAAIEQMPATTRSQAYYNQGNSLFQQKKLEEALEAYKNAMRLNPGDQEAKFNYAYTKKLLEKNQDQDDKDNDQDQDQDQDKNQDNNNDQNQDQDKDNQQGDDKNDPGDQDKDPGDQQNDDKNDNGEEGQDNRQGGMSQDEAERLLDAMQGAEDNTRDKMDAEKASAVAPSGKNW